MEHLRIGIVCYPTYGGSGVIATELGMALAKKGHKIHFITHRRPARLSTFQENVYFHEVSTMEYPLFEHQPYETALASKLVDVVLYEKLDLLHVHYAIPHASAAFLAKKILEEKGIRIPYITTLHGTDITLVGTDRSYAPVVEFSINQSDGVTVVSNSLREETLDNFDIHNEIRVIYNFIDFDRFKKTDRDHFRKLLAPNGEKILVHTSNFRKVKRVDDVIRIFYLVNRQIPSKLLLVGDGPERPELEAMCRSLGLCDDIRFLGKQEAIEEILSISDLFIIPSGKESFGLAALEAMACEVPVISSNAGGLPEVNIHDKTGFVSKIGDVDEMAAMAVRLLQNEDRFQEFRRAALERAQEFSIENILPQYESYYKEVIERHSEPSEISVQ